MIYLFVRLKEVVRFDFALVCANICWFQVSLEDFLESCGGVATSSTSGGRTTGGPTLLTELEDDEDGVLEEEEDNEENDQEVIAQHFTSSLYSSNLS